MTACGADKGAETTAASTTPASTEETLGIALQADFGGAEYRVLSSGPVSYTDFTFEEESSQPLENAQYKRKLKVQEDYHVKIVEDTAKSGTATGNGPGFQSIFTAVNAGECQYELGLISGYDVSVLAYNNALYDLASIDQIDLSKSWWDQNAINSLSVKGVTFFTTGDITCSDNDSTFCLVFNKDLFSRYGLTSPYELVQNGEWTIAKLGEYCKTVSEDLNSDSKMDKNDRFGLLVWDDSILGIVNGAGQRCCTINADGEIVLTLSSETTISALEAYMDIAYDTQSAFTYQRYIKSGSDMWQNDQCLFWTTLIGNVPTFRAMESDFGILPYPKNSTAQDSYYSTISPYNSQFICVPKIQNDLDMCGTVTEALAYYGQEMVLEPYYEINLQGQSTRDADSYEMLDIIFDNLMYDIGYYYQIGPYNKQLILMVRNFDRNFASMYDTYINAANAQLSIINNAYQEAVEEWQK